jgi:trehalose-6-phosphate synthase
MILSFKLIALIGLGIVALTFGEMTGGVLFGAEASRHAVLRILPQVVWTAVITWLVVRSAVLRPIANTARWLQDLRSGNVKEPPARGLLGPLCLEIAGLAQSLGSARAAAEKEAELRDTAESLWTADRLRAYVRRRLPEGALFVVSNREPYMHVRRGAAIEIVVPASGLVTALEPILRACNGTWVALGSGNADRLRVDGSDRLRVPPDRPEYSLRRVWLAQDEEDGYYNGFANEGLWPLCHIAHTRPFFRESDWVCYQAANRRFVDAVLEEMRGAAEPTVLVQDYHFALVARSIKASRPDARVAVFWHIPWPNPEAFAICPWQRELLDGLLGADLIGFHTRTHARNFLETVDRAFEAQIEWDHSTVRRNGHVTHVGAFPISVGLSDGPGPSFAHDALRKQFGVATDLVGLGVDRVDYTKGILERFRGIERFFEKWDRYIERFTFLQIAAPSRMHIKRYQALFDEMQAEAARINERFGTSSWQPIVVAARHHSHTEIAWLYRTADICMVTSLHDGMNLVAKEFVAARGDGDGVLILSQFTGAARELRDALIVNPYDSEQVADAIRRALDMNEDERRGRMHAMRGVVREANVYRWAATLLGELSNIRLDDGNRVDGFQTHLDFPISLEKVARDPARRPYAAARRSA